MVNNGAQDFLQDGRFFSRLERYNSSKQGAGETSFRVLYYGGTAGSVPFLWESRPGTPKQTFNDGDPPPLTPPPSFRPVAPAKRSLTKRGRSKILNFFLLKLPSRKVEAQSPQSSDGRRGEGEPESPTSNLCFGSGSGSPRRSGCSSPMKSVRKMVQSIMVGNSDSE